MSEEQFETHNPGEGFEKEDLSPLGVMYFMGGLAVVGVLVYFILVGMYRYLDAQDRARQAPMNPMALKTGIDPATMNYNDINKKAEEAFPKPVLEYSERLQFTGEVAKQDQVLGSYDWVDQKSGVVRIPIDRAIDIIAERGLPVIPTGEAAKAGVPAKAQAASSTAAGGARQERKSQ
jgi:hypothetical protein